MLSSLEEREWPNATRGRQHVRSTLQAVQFSAAETRHPVWLRRLLETGAELLCAKYVSNIQEIAYIRTQVLRSSRS